MSRERPHASRGSASRSQVNRRGQRDVFIGRSTHKLRPTGDDFKIFFKKVLLVNGDEYIDNLTFSGLITGSLTALAGSALVSGVGRSCFRKI